MEIWKFTCDSVENEMTFTVPKNTKIISCINVKNSLNFYGIVPDMYSDESELKTIRCFMTGENIVNFNLKDYTFINTLILNEWLVVHIFIRN
jgi:hypothetical protein